jgi:hypothetical protein
MNDHNGGEEEEEDDDDDDEWRLRIGTCGVCGNQGG